MGIRSKTAVEASSLRFPFLSPPPLTWLFLINFLRRRTLEHVELYKLICPKWMLSKHIGYSRILAISIMQALNQTHSLALSPPVFLFTLSLFQIRTHPRTYIQTDIQKYKLRNTPYIITYKQKELNTLTHSNIYSHIGSRKRKWVHIVTHQVKTLVLLASLPGNEINKRMQLASFQFTIKSNFSNILDKIS